MWKKIFWMKNIHIWYLLSRKLCFEWKIIKSRIYYGKIKKKRKEFWWQSTNLVFNVKNNEFLMKDLDLVFNVKNNEKIQMVFNV